MFIYTAFVFLFSGSVIAATITVTSTNDNGAGSLRHAISSAGSGDTIIFSGVSGTITLTSGHLVIDKNLTIEGPGASLLSISGNNASRGFFVNGGITVTLSGMTITNGYGLYGYDPNGYYYGGGGIYNGGTLTIIDSNISGNNGVYGGGAIASRGTLTVNNCRISANIGEPGGGIYSSGAGLLSVTDSIISDNSELGLLAVNELTVSNSIISNNQGGGIMASTLTVTGSTISGNTPYLGLGGFRGGGIHGNQVIVNNSTVSNNSKSDGYGGGIIAASGSIANSRVLGNTIENGDGGGIYGGGTITNSTISGNRANNGNGGGIYGNGEVSNSSVSDNTASGSGGGIYNSDKITVSNTTVSGNAAFVHGGAIYNSDKLTVSNTTISSNTASGAGGGIYNIFGQYCDEEGCYPRGTAYMINSTITFNTAAMGGGIFSFSSAVTETLNNTIVAGNTGQGADISGAIDAASHSLIGDTGSSGGIPNGVNGNIVGVNPLLGPLQNNGGPTMTHGLLPGSPAVNAGENILAIGSTDQRGLGFARIFGGTVDIGSFEIAALTSVSVAGRVTTPDGTGLRSAVVSIIDPDGTRRTAVSSTLGYFQFDNVAAGKVYSLNAVSRRYRFQPRNLDVNSSLANVDLVGLE
jgi:hypothetical protein